MATIFQNGDFTTPGERRFAQRLQSHLEDDYWCYYNVPVGRLRRYPDFILLHPGRGLLFLEVKDWKLSSIVKISHDRVALANGQTTTNPIKQVRESAFSALETLQQDAMLCHQQGAYQGKLVFPWGHGVIFPNITRKQFDMLLQQNEALENIWPSHLVLCADEIRESVECESFQAQLWGMFNYSFKESLTLPQIDRIRWAFYPEIRIQAAKQGDLFIDESTPRDITDIIKVMDMQQEQLARSLGNGHRVIHGVAGSGKTLILGYRCHYLASTLEKPILVLCFNITLAARLRSLLSVYNLNNAVDIYHFHDWCGQQMKTYHVDLVKGDRAYFERLVETVIQGVDKGQIPREQYGAVLIDEGHDFEADWLKLIVQMIDKQTDSLLLLYDDAQSIYQKKNSMGFTLSSVGIKARGRTSILKLNYRNTREILQFAFDFIEEQVERAEVDEDKIPLITPEYAGQSGPQPRFFLKSNFDQEVQLACDTIEHWLSHGVQCCDIAVIYMWHWQGEAIAKQLIQREIPSKCLSTSVKKKHHDFLEDAIVCLTRESSKGLEYEKVIIVGVGSLSDDEERYHREARLLYVAMTRAQKELTVIASKKNRFTEKLANNECCGGAPTGSISDIKINE